MIALLRAELRRLTSRRLVRVLAALVLLVLLVVEVRAFFVSNRDLDAARARAGVSSHLPAEQVVAMCHSMQSNGDLPDTVNCDSPSDAGLAVEQIISPPNEGFVDPRLFASDALPKGATAVAVAVAILGFLVGASFVGADWHAGTMQALLFWEPRRWRVLVAKGIAVVSVMVAFAAAMHLVNAGLTWIVAATRGSTAGVTSGLLASTGLTMLRGMIVIAFTSLLGYAVAGLTRVTAAALGAAFVYFVILENLIRVFRGGWQRFLLSENINAVMFKHTQVADAHGRLLDFDSSLQHFYRLGGVRGTVTLAIYLGLLLGAFYVTFNRRDVT